MKLIYFYIFYSYVSEKKTGQTKNNNLAISTTFWNETIILGMYYYSVE